MGHRKRPRAKMVLPVRVWGTDSAGKSFNVLAYTLDISSSGARLGGVRVPLSVGEAVTLQYKQQRALFKVAWVGRPGEKTHEQLGIYALEPDKHIWLEIPEPPQFVDDFEPKGKPAAAKAPAIANPAPPPAATASPAATPAVSSAAAPVAPSAQPQPAPATAASAIASDDVSALLRACAHDLLRIDELVKQKPTDRDVLHEFREAVSKVRQTTWALQQWQELNQESDQPFPLLWYVNSERLRFVVQAVQELWKDVGDKGVEIDETLLEPLFSTIERMRIRYPGGAPPADAIDLTDESHRALNGEHPPATAASRLVQQVTAMQRDLERAHPDVDSALHFVADSMLHILDADGLTIAVADQGEMVCTSSVGVAPEVGMVVDTESGLGAEAVASRQFVYCRDTQGDPRVDAESCAAANIGSVLMLPINSDLGAPIAMFEISSARKNAFADEHLLALKAAAAIVQSLLAAGVSS